MIFVGEIGSPQTEDGTMSFETGPAVDMREGTGGRWYLVDARGRVVGLPATREECSDFLDSYEGPSCSICDALGHGYLGGGPCPLEDRGEDDLRERELQAMDDARRFTTEDLFLVSDEGVWA